MGKSVTLLFAFYTLFIFSTNLFAQAPVITQQPVWQGIIEGQTATFKVKASGDTLTYQWYKDGAIVSGATDSIYTTPVASLADNGTLYSVKVTNSSGSIDSKEAKLIVTKTTARVTANEIVEYNFKEGSGYTIHDVSGINPKVHLSIDDTDKVAWSPNGLLVQAPVKIQSDTSTSKLANSCMATNELTVEAWIVPHDTIQSDAHIVTYQGWYTSRRFSLIQNSRNYTVLTRIIPGTDLTGTPGIRTYNGDVEMYLTHVVYTRSANDDSVKIFKNGKEIYADTISGDLSWGGPSIRIMALAGIYPNGNNWLGTYYYVGIYNRALSNSEIEHNYEMKIDADYFPYIAKQPQDTSAFEGETATFSVAALSYSLYSLTYQWQKNGVNIPGATNAEYTTDSLTVSDYNSTYRVIVSNSQGTDTSRSALLNLKFTTPPAPSNLKAIKYHADTTKIDLSWDDNSPNELGFVIQRKLGDSSSVSSYLNIDTVDANVTAFTDSTTMDTTKYTYRVFAYDADTISSYSNVATVTTPLPVELTSFMASSVNSKMVIEWQTATEINNAGFSIERSPDNQKFSEVAFIKGKGTSTEKSLYRYVDNSALSGKYYYRLKQVDFDGTYSYSKTIEADLGLPKNYALDQNYPNPFNPSTTIRFAIPTNAKVSIKLYNTLGQEVKNLFKSEVNAGVHETLFNAANLSSGIYFYRIEAQGNDGSSFTATKRMLLLK